MNAHKLKLITVIAEDELETRIVADIKSCGATGYTSWNVRGAGLYGARTSMWEGENVQIETIVDAATAERICDLLSRTYFDHFAIILFTTDADVLRPDHFAGRGGRSGP